MEIKELQNNNNTAIENLNHIIDNKSQEICYLIDEIDSKNVENQNLAKQVKNIYDHFEHKVTILESENKTALSSIHSARKDSLDILKNIKNDDKQTNKERNQCVKNDSQEKHKSTEIEINQDVNADVNFLKEIELLQKINLESVHFLQNENIQLKKSFEVAKKENEELKRELLKQEEFMEKFKQLNETHENILNEKETLQIDLHNKILELDKISSAFRLSEKESETLISQLHESKCIQEEYVQLKELYQKVIADRNILQDKLLHVEKTFTELHQSHKTISEENKILQLNLEEFKENYKKLKDTNNVLQIDYNDKIIEINDLYNSLENKTKENRDLNVKITNLETFECLANNKIDSFKSEKSNIQLKLNTLKKQNSDLNNKLRYYEHLENNFNNLTIAHDKLKVENENLQKDLLMQLEYVMKLQQENANLNNESKTLLIHSEDLEKALLHARVENLTQTDSLHVHYDNVKKEIDILQQEKISCHKKIGDLLDKLEESEFLRSNLDEMIISKDKKIFTLENHINELEDEIRRLQYNLNEVIETGEQIKQLSYERIDKSFEMMEAHHSKATHNMKIELAKLQNKNANLESQLSSTKLITEKSSKNENNYYSQIKDLQKERLEIISQIKQLEQNSLGDSNLSLDNCTINDVIASLNRIHKFISEKNAYLEKTLTNVQASYQLLKSKADEAKIIAEEERQKIINEKGDILKERKHFEEQLQNLKNENLNYEKVIKDLQGEIMNQKLLFNRSKQLNEDHVLKLKEKNVSLQDLYDNSLNTIRELQEKLNTRLTDKNNYLDEIERLKLALEEKNKEILKVQKNIEAIKNKSFQHFTAQTTLISSSKYVESQTDPLSNLNENINENNLENSESSKTKNVEPTFNFVKNVYINYKIKRLSLGKLEHYSITDLREISEENECQLLKKYFSSKSPVLNTLSPSIKNDSDINICDSQIFTNSTKDTSDKGIYTSKNESIKTSTLIDSEQNNNNFVNEFNENIVLNDSISSEDKDMFLIYKESQSIYDDQANTENRYWPQTGFTNMIVERAAIHTKEKPFRKRQKSKQNLTEQSFYEEKDDDSLKPKLNINMPRVFRELSTTTLSDDDIRSLNSYNQNLYESPKWEIYSDTKINSNFSKNINKSNLASRIQNVNRVQNSKKNQNVISKDKIHLKQKIDIKSVNKNKYSSNDVHVNKKQALTAESSIDSICNTYSSPNLSRVRANIAILNNIAHNSAKEHKYMKNFSSGSNQSEQYTSFKTLPTEDISIDNKKPSKVVTDCGILVKLDAVEDYENKIQQLTDTLEDIEKYYKNKMEAIKIQYENNVKHIINEHNQGVVSIQNLHEEAIHEIINKHENEIENLRSMSIEAMRKAERLENENRCLKLKNSNNNNMPLGEIPILTSEMRKKKSKSRSENKRLTKTIIDAFNVKPKKRSHGPCTCSLDINISDTIRNIFEQADVELRQMAEMAYIKYIANKIFNDNVEVLDSQELSFLHLKVCRTWKARLNNEETPQDRIDSFEMADLDRKVAEEWRRLQEVREAVCRTIPNPIHDSNPEAKIKTPAITEKDVYYCNSVSCNIEVEDRRSAGDLETKPICGTKSNRGKLESNRAVLVKLDIDQPRERKLYSDEAPTRLKRSHDRQYSRTAKK